ncbi:two-component sensor histidine kinase [Clostridium omnivorum]|uniref:histidine kinase n=1 Tax=Clostridium omnivorum TaxID=1604902 RepID=A0ABQ5N1U1_9CLOT|nr:two-component sensor histidine kinase [Clostridium sp. E14]
MKFLWRIFWLCISVYIISLSTVAVVVTERSYNNLLKSEIERSLKEEEYVGSNISLYLITNKRLLKEKMEIKNFTDTIIDMFGTKDNFIELYSYDLRLLSTNVPKEMIFQRDEIKVALKEGKNYVLRNYGGKYYIFITETIQTDGEEIVLAFIKDITAVKQQRVNEYKFFLQAGMLGLIIVAALARIMGKVVTSPIGSLSGAVQNISSGNYKERVDLKSKDEIGVLANEFNKMADEIERRIEALKLEGESKQRFIDNLTHELRTPLTSIIGYSELIETTNYDEAMIKKGVGYINSEGKRMLKMVNSMMNMILLRENTLSFEKYNIQPLLEEVMDIMKVKAVKKNVSITREGRELELEIDLDLFKEVLLNLVDNALNVSSAGKNIAIGAEIYNKRNCVYVRDEGKGISEEDISKIFEPFYRVDQSRARKAGGMGLGLSICNEIIKAHGAEFKVESELGQGTVVRIIF